MGKSPSAFPLLSCSLSKDGDYFEREQKDLVAEIPFLLDIKGNSISGELIEARVESLTNIRFGDLNSFRLTLFINFLEVVSRQVFILILPIGQTRFPKISFEGHLLQCQV